MSFVLHVSASQGVSWSFITALAKVSARTHLAHEGLVWSHLILRRLHVKHARGRPSLTIARQVEIDW